MAITIGTAPFKFSPSGNPVYFGVTSDNANIKYFQFSVYEATTDGLIGTYDMYTTPDNTTGAYANLETILNSYTNWHFKDYTTNLVDDFTENILKYYIVIKERLYSGGVVSDGTSLTTDDYYVFNGLMDRITFQSYKQSQYLVALNRKVLFMTDKPNFSKVNEFSEEGLFFLNDNFTDDLYASYKFYKKDGSTIPESFAAQIVYDEDIKVIRLNASPAYLQANHSVDFSEVYYYTVELVDGDGALMSETKVYYFESIQCNLTPVNIYWVNQFGMIDTYQFVNPEYSMSVERVTVKRNPYVVNELGKVVDYTGALFNVIDEVLTATATQKVTLNTRDLSDNENKWLSSILTTKQAIIKISDSLYIPVLVSSTDVTLTNRRYLGALNIKQYAFQFSDGFTADYKVVDASSTPPPAILLVDADFYVRHA